MCSLAAMRRRSSPLMLRRSDGVTCPEIPTSMGSPRNSMPVRFGVMACDATVRGGFLERRATHGWVPQLLGSWVATPLAGVALGVVTQTSLNLLLIAPLADWDNPGKRGSHP
jgi:hypothetical protein